MKAAGYTALLLFAASLWASAGSVPAEATDKKAREDALRSEYFSPKASVGSGAVDSAVSWLVQQEIMGEGGAAAERGPAGTDAEDALARDIPSATPGGLPTCAVTHARIVEEGTFVRTGGDAPYDWSCWTAKARYHTAPICAANKTKDPAYRWTWTLRSALEGKCVMPDASPTHAARSYLEHRTHAVGGEDAEAASGERVVTNIMLGFSFMGQVSGRESNRSCSTRANLRLHRHGPAVRLARVPPPRPAILHRLIRLFCRAR